MSEYIKLYIQSLSIARSQGLFKSFCGNSSCNFLYALCKEIATLEFTAVLKRKNSTCATDLGRNVLTFSSSDVGAGILSVDVVECAFLALAVMRSIGLGLASLAPSPTSSFSVLGELFAALDMTTS